MRTAAAVVAEARPALKPPVRLKLSEWADLNFYLSSESSAEPGRWRTLPYQRAWLDAITDPRIEQITLMKSARVGWTKCLNATIAYHVDHDPCSMLLIQPTEDDAKGYSKEEIAPMLRDLPLIGDKFIKTANQLDSLLHKRFRGGILQLAGARSPGNFRRVSRRLVMGDEVDGYPPSAGREGDPIELAKRRAEHFWNRKFLWGSTPLVAGASRIEQLFLEGDQRRYYVPCPHCGCMQVLQFEHLRWPKGQPAAAVFVCIDCGAEIEHAHKRDMVHAGEWRPGPHPQFADVPPPPPFHGHVSFHFWAAYSFSPNATWGQIASEYAAAAHAGADRLKTCVNTVLGQTWTELGEAPEWKALYARRMTYPIGTVPAGVLFLTAGVDVQKDRVVYEVVGWGRDKRSWSVDYGELPGDTADLERGPWAQVDALLARAYPHVSGLTMGVQMLAIDSGFNTQTVYSWAKKYPLSRVVTVKGFDRGGILVGSPTPVEITHRGRKLKRGGRLWPVAVGIAKSELYGWLRLEAPLEGEEPSPGFCQFPQYNDEYFRQLTAEQLVAHKTSQGFTRFEWELIPGRQNHVLDARVYARAAAFLAGLDRFRESDWSTLESRLGTTPSSTTPASEPPPTPTTTPPPAPRRSRGFLDRRGGLWLKGGR